MKLKSVELKKFKRFTDINITDIPETAKLMVLIGPNGSGKTSLFEAFKTWSGLYGGTSSSTDPYYIGKGDINFFNNWPEKIKLTFYNQPLALDQNFYRKSFYIRTAYRNDPDFIVTQLRKMGTALESSRFSRLIDNDASVHENYQRIVSYSVEKLYSSEFDSMTIKKLREMLIGKIRESMKRVFDDLILTGPGDPLKNGTFYFEKGTSKDFHYKNLSGGEKAAFDIILDLIIKCTEFDDSIYCIDEPDLHLHTKLQGKLLGEIYNLIPENSQLWIATHSIGMLRKAFELQKQNPDKVVFLDFHDKNLDQALTINPVKVTRELWKKTLEVALDDLAQLVAPKQIVICEGKPSNLSGKNKEFDARCLRKIFSEGFPDTDFVSVGNEDGVRAEKIDLVTTLKSISPGVLFIKVIDRDDRSETEVTEIEEKECVKVLKRREIENYLLDDEILKELCNDTGNEPKVIEVLNLKEQALTDSIGRGNPSNDLKSAAGDIYTSVKKLLNLTNCGNTTEAFLSDTMAPLVTPETRVYKELKSEIFG